MTKRRYRGSARGGRFGRGVAGRAACLLAALGWGACDDGVVDLDALRFGQIGEVRVRVQVPLQHGQGRLQQVISWNSEGAWVLREAISYGERLGDETVKGNPGVPLQYAGAYATLISELNESQSQVLAVDETLDPDCGLVASRVTLSMRDEARGEEKSWTRCAFGALTTLRTQDSGPDGAASRVVDAAIRIWRRTLGSDSVSVYAGSLPFGTLERGGRTGTTLERPVAFRSADGAGPDEAPPGWGEFWSAHTRGEERAAPEVDWATEMVLFAAVGVREEVGDSVEVRRVLTIAEGTRVVVVEQVPGDFCAPLHRMLRPYHLVVAPKAVAPVSFAEVAQERVPCGAG